MRNAFSRATNGRAGVVIGVVALVAALGGSAIALPGKNSVDSGDIKNAQVKTKDMKIAYLRVNGSGVLSTKKGVKGTDVPTSNVLCLDLAFKPKTGSATRGADSGASDEPFRIPQIAIGTATAALCNAPFNDAAVQVPGSLDLYGLYANFIG